MKRILIVLGLALCLIVVCLEVGVAEVVSLNPIVVSYYDQLKEASSYDVASNIQVYSNDKIENSSATSLLDFLKKIPTINVSDYYGTGVKATVDIMGYGANASSNVLVLVNGRRVNDIDLSGVDWTQIPLENVESIEIMKGGGVVLYGDNATGGVISIVTKKPKSKDLKVNLSTKFGSYSLDNEVVEVEKASDKFSFYINSGHYGTNGYRENSFYSSDSIYAHFDFNPSDNLDLSFESGYQNCSYGLPGSLYITDLAGNYTRTDTKTPDDNARMEDRYVNSRINYKIQEDVKASISAYLRDKNGRDEFYWSGGSSLTDKHIQQKGAKIQFFIDREIYGLKNSLIFGADLSEADYSANSTSSTDIDRRSLAVFIQDQFNLADKLSALFGARYQKDRFTFDHIPSSGSSIFDDGLNLDEEGYEVGINYKWNDNTNTFFHFARAFRVPKTDEYFVSSFPSSSWSPASPASIKTTLTPQRSKTYTLGTNSRINEKITVNTDLFLSNVGNELYYDDLTYLNDNYPKIERLGFNLSTTICLTPDLSMDFGYRYINAEFKKGDHKGKKVPFVPENLFSYVSRYDFKDLFSVYFDLNYRDKVYRINDLNNAVSKLDSYWVANLKLDYKFKENFLIYFGINNLFNEKYSEYGSYSNFSGDMALYPSPEMNYYAGAKYSF